MNSGVLSARWSKAMTIEQRENVLAEFDAVPTPRAVGDVDPVALPSHTRTIAPIIRAYDSLIIRLYCLLRFRIIRGRFLEEISQFLPTEGNVFEVGCGFGGGGVVERWVETPPGRTCVRVLDGQLVRAKDGGRGRLPR